MNDIRIPDWQSRGRGWETLHILLKSPLKNTNFSPTYADDLQFISNNENCNCDFIFDNTSFSRLLYSKRGTDAYKV